jgi:hypothetical protein
MPSRSDKQRKLAENIRTNAERATRMECQKQGIGRLNPRALAIYKKFYEEFRKSALEIEEKQLHEVWN